MKITATKLTVVFGNSVALRDLSFVIDEKAINFLTGENGSGKSTLLRLLAGFINPTAGKIVYHEFGSTKDRLEIGEFSYLSEKSLLTLNLTVYQAILLSRMGNKASADEVIYNWQLKNLLNKKISEISLGERRRVSLARSLKSGKKLVLLDEPFANLDQKVSNILNQTLSVLQAEGTTILLALHDFNRFTEGLKSNCKVIALKKEENERA
ncbi:MAG TPA: ATP-binding cassette domain-containing protein [Oligoflexia bacterium]|nr:ATP-binding cassette domain-containing protein [Oligoflexia bacterium]HMP27405.1 ATP-binding cassette domain-containing protein [Oligoflexia bacterium]